MNKLIVHYIASDKFTSGYISYMHNNIKEYRHIFITDKSAIIKNNADGAEILFISRPSSILTNKNIRKMLDKCDKFIVSGVFDKTVYIPFLSCRILLKTYLHFWGGDFYCLRDKADRQYLKKKGLKLYIRRKIYFIIKKLLIQKCAAVITLIEEDYDELVRITGISKHHLVAPMPGGDGYSIKAADNIKKHVEPHLIQVGNSATESNHHIDVFKLLKKYSEENIKIICPLSYGNKEYAKQIADYGIKLFGSKFVPIKSVLPEDEYFNLLAKVEVAVFNNDRQQAMGNIIKLLSMGCKVYMRNGTSMWKAYKRQGFSVYNIDDINSENFSSFISFSEDEASQNKKAYLKTIDPVAIYNAWKRVFEDKI